MKTPAPQPVRALQLAAAVSLVILLAGAWAVFRWWYPLAFWQASGVSRIASYALLAHLGITSLLVLPWRNRKKDAEGVKADAAFLVFVMTVAALFSLSFLFAGRPVALVFAVDRVALVRANEVRTTEFALADAFTKELRRSGPLQLMAARLSGDAERLESIQLAMAGFDLHQRPSFWVDIQEQRHQLIQKAVSVRTLDGSLTNQLAEQDGASENFSVYLPLAGVSDNWVLLLDGNGMKFVPLKIE